MKRKYYLIDTENVGDRWFDLPAKIRKKDRVITFYTKNHSKHLEAYLAEQIHNPKILWLECIAGNNALDYQLIGVLSYLIARYPEASFCIFSNDKDYQGIVGFWQSRGIAVSQKGFIIEDKKKKKNGKKKKKRGVKGKKAGNGNIKEENITKEMIMPVYGIIEKLKQTELTDKQYFIEIAKSVPVANLGGWYQALTAIMGQEKGRNYYQDFKADDNLKESLLRYYVEDKYFRGVNLAALVLYSHNLDIEKAEDIYKIIHSHNEKKIKDVKADFNKKFNNESQYFKVLQPVIRVIKKI